MNKILTFIFLLALSLSLRAEYDGYYISFTIEQVNGKKQKGYVYMASAYLDMDSLHNTNYLKRALGGKDGDDQDSMTYFKHRIDYHYRNTWDSSISSKYTTYYLTGQKKMPFRLIKKITIDEMIDHTYLFGISTDLKLADTSWIKTEPVKILSYSGYLCSYQVMVHQQSKRLTEVLKRLDAKQKQLSSMELDSENGDKADEEIGKLISELEGLKVVVITECTC